MLILLFLQGTQGIGNQGNILGHFRRVGVLAVFGLRNRKILQRSGNIGNVLEQFTN